jgi:hypothetical protein
LLGAAFVLYALAWFAVGCWLVFRRVWVVMVPILFLLAAAGMASWWGYIDYRIAQDEEHPVVVVALNGVTLRRGNGSLYPQHSQLPIVNRGMEGRLLTERGDWLQVRFPGGETGWLPAGAVAREASTSSFADSSTH